jgi:alkylated DNA repair protein (DNA oxidative demethylase)
MLTVISPARSDAQSTRSRPSAIHLPGWLNMSQQRQIVEAFHDWSAGPLPIRATSLPGGHQMSVRTLRLGQHQQPSTRNASVPDGQRVTEFPGWLAYIGQAAISTIYGPLAAAAYRPDTALVNYYDPGPRPWGGAVRSRLLMPYAALTATKAADASWNDRTPSDRTPRPGQDLRIHQDNGESISDLAVSLSLGDRCSFRLSNTGNHGYPCTDLTLSSGDTLVFGRQARFACHDEPRIYPGTGHPGSGLTRGRINLTLRITVPAARPWAETGLATG